jgi:1-acyl-sn-glycerol-3-phosphate acyltransferase
MKGKQGMQTVKQMLKTLKEGHSVCLFPEGNRSFNGLTGKILPSIGKVAQCSGAKLVTYRIEGGYLTQPRWSLSLRRGRLKGSLINVYSAETLKQMTGDQINRAICKDLHEDAYETQKRERIAYKGKNLALGLESTVFLCPDCGKIGTLHSRGARLFCECGFDAVYDEYGELTDRAKNKYTVTELDLMQQKKLVQMLEVGEGVESPLFTDKVTLYEIDKDHNLVNVAEGEMMAYADRIECCGKTFLYKEMQGMAIYSRNAMILHENGHKGHFEIKADQAFCALKYLYLYQTKEKVN